MIDQPGRLPLAQYLRVLDLARHLDPSIVADISIESVEDVIKRQLDASLPAFHARVGFKSYEELKQEEEGISRILDTIEGEIRPVASEFTPGFLNRLQQEYQGRWNTVRDKLKLSDELDNQYRQIREEEEEALKKRKEKLLEAHQMGIGLKSVTGLAEEIKQLEEGEGALKRFLRGSAEEWAELAEQQTDLAKAKELWEKVMQRDNSLELCDRREKHIATLKLLEEKAAASYEGLLQQAQELYDLATRPPLQSAYSPDNDLRQASEKCEYIIEGLANHPYPSSIRQEATRLKGRINSYNNLIWHSRAIEHLAQAEVDLTGNHLAQASENITRAREAFAMIWDSNLQSSLAERLDAVQQRIELMARQQTNGVIDRWRQQAQIYLDGQDAVAALNCIYSARALGDAAAPEYDSLQQLDALEDTALAMLCREINPHAKVLAERAQEILSQQDSRSAFRWLEAALKLDASAILSDSGFQELIDAYFDFQAKRHRLESLLFQAEARLARDPRSPDGMAAAEDLLSEAKAVLGQIGETERLQEIEEKITSLQQRHREALLEELNGLLQKLEEKVSSQETPEILPVLKDLAQVLAKIEMAKLIVQNVKPHLEKAFEYYAQLRSADESKGDKGSIEGYSLSYMLLSKVSGWKTN